MFVHENGIMKLTKRLTIGEWGRKKRKNNKRG
jgi:hypothetical protein